MAYSLSRKAIFLSTILFTLQSTSVLAGKAEDDLTYTANFGNAADIRIMTKAGASPDAKDEKGWPALSLAASRTDQDAIMVVTALVESGANLNIRDPKGETPLMNAIATGNAQIVRYLISKGADYHATTAKGEDVLFKATWFGNKEIIDLVQSAIREEEERIREGKSRKRMYKRLDEYIYYHCAYQYITYNEQIKNYKSDKLKEVAETKQKALDFVQNAQTELQYNFRMPADYLEKLSSTIQRDIYTNLNIFVTDRYRRAQGVGTDTDLDKRCQTILKKWQQNFDAFDKLDAQNKAAPASKGN